MWRECWPLSALLNGEQSMTSECRTRGASKWTTHKALGDQDNDRYMLHILQLTM